jgi:hypothetical protein
VSAHGLVGELGIAEETIVVYSTDNGPHMNSWPDAGMTPFRGEKNSNWEGAYGRQGAAPDRAGAADPRDDPAGVRDATSGRAGAVVVDVSEDICHGPSPCPTRRPPVALARCGRMNFEKMLTYANHLGLYSEEIALTGEQIGNFPRGFTHLALVDAAVTIDAALDQARTPSR